MRDEEQIAKWGELAGFNGASEPSDLAGLFQFFRPDGRGVEKIFENLPYGDAVVGRLLRCYECTARGFDGTQPYFVPTPSVQYTDSESLELLAAHFAEMSRLAMRKQDTELVDLLSNAQPQRVGTAEELAALLLSDDCPNSWVGELVTDYLCFLERHDTQIFLLRDAMYSMANDFFLRGFLQWPLFVDSAIQNDPFQPYFDLWSKGVSFAFEKGGMCCYAVLPAAEGKKS